MVVNDACDFLAHVRLACVQLVVVNERHLLDAVRVWELLPELVVEVEIFVRYLAVGQMLINF